MAVENIAVEKTEAYMYVFLAAANGIKWKTPYLNRPRTGAEDPPLLSGVFLFSFSFYIVYNERPRVETGGLLSGCDKQWVEKSPGREHGFVANAVEFKRLEQIRFKRLRYAGALTLLQHNALQKQTKFRTSRQTVTEFMLTGDPRIYSFRKQT